MKKLLTALVVSCAFSTAAFAADAPASAPAAKPMSAQQNRMKECNADAGDKKAMSARGFMKTCLSNKAKTQQEKMKSCNADPKAKELKGADRKAFMKDCLSK